MFRQVTLALAFFVAWGAAMAQAEKRALVVGVDRYDYLSAEKQLQKAVNDARAVGKALESVGFSVESSENPDRREFFRLWAKFKSRLEPGDVAAFYFSGHAVELGGANYLVPRDVEPIKAATEEAESVLRDSSINLNDLLAELRARRLQVSLQIIDACRENPFADAKGRSLGGAKGLGRIEQPEGNFIMYSAGARQQALDRLSDDDPDPNSVYTRSLLPLLVRPGLNLTDVAKKVRTAARDLAITAGSEQTPAYYDGLTSDFYLAGEQPGKISESGASPNPDKETAALKEELEKLRAEKNERTAAASPPAAPALETPVKPAVGVWQRLSEPAVGESIRDCADCPELVVVPAGSFMMGSPPDEPERAAEEGPQHKVTFARPFAIGKFPVTLDQYKTFVLETRRAMNGGCVVWARNEFRLNLDRSYLSPGFEQDGSHPVVCVSWDDAQAYVKWLSGKTGKGYRLPSEAEREYVTRAGTITPFWWGKTISPDQANYNGTYVYAGGGAKGKWRQKTVPVKSFKPNRWGLYQVHGNIWDWTEDCWSPSYEGAPTDGSARTTGDCSRRVFRGGSWFFNAKMLRAAARLASAPGHRPFARGFRVARTLSP